MTQQLHRINAANDACMAGDAPQERLQIELEAPLLLALLRERRLQAAHLRACNPESAQAIHRLLLGCLATPGR